MMMIMLMAARLVLPMLLMKKKDGTPMSAAIPKQISCRLVRLKRIFDLTLVRSRGTGIYDAMCLPPLMGAHDRFGQASGLEEREAQQHRVAHDAPDAPDDVICKGDRLDQHRIDADADHDQKALEAQSEQRSQIVLADVALFPVAERGERDRSKARHEIDLHHTAIDDDKDRHGQDRGADLNDEALQEQSQKLAQFHSFQ